MLFDLSFGGIVWGLYVGFTWGFFGTPLYFSAVIPGAKSITLVPLWGKETQQKPRTPLPRAKEVNEEEDLFQ